MNVTRDVFKKSVQVLSPPSPSLKISKFEAKKNWTMRNLLLDFDLPHSKRNRVWMTIKNVRSRIEKPKAICEKRDARLETCADP